MRILVLTPHRYGIREVAKRIGHEWEEMGHDVEYDLPDGTPARLGPLTVGVPKIALWWRQKFKELSQSSREYDLIWTHQPLSPTLPTSNPELWDRVIATFHTTEHTKYRLARNGIYPQKRLPVYWVTRQLERRFYQQLAKLESADPQYTVVSSQLHAEIKRFGIENAVTVPNGIVVPDDEESFEGIRHEYGIPTDATVIFNIGRVTSQKRPLLFAKTLAQICERNEEMYCVMAGEGPLSDDIKKYASESFRLPGYISDEEKWRWFSDADIFASLSAYEGMPVATLEALSFGLPVVLSDIPAHRAVIEDYAATGFCVEPDVPQVVSALEDAKNTTADVSLPTWREIAGQYLSYV